MTSNLKLEVHVHSCWNGLLHGILTECSTQVFLQVIVVLNRRSLKTQFNVFAFDDASKVLRGLHSPGRVSLKARRTAHGR